jgi:hypothetical protein
MARNTSRALKQGAVFGVIAALIFAVIEIIASAAMGNPALMPFRMFASIVLGMAAMQTVSLAAAVIVGLIVHVVLAAAFGLIYGFLASRLSGEAQAGWGTQSLMGLAFGVAVWLVNFQIIARLLYPWFLNAPQFLQAVLHAVFFGLPLGLMYAAAERRRGLREPRMREEVPEPTG